MIQRERWLGDLSAPLALEASSKYEQAFFRALDFLYRVEPNPSQNLVELASLQYKYEGFATALVTLQDPNISPANATRLARGIANDEINKGNRENALEALEVAVETAAVIPPDRDGDRDKMEYLNIAHYYARVGEGERTFQLIDKIGGYAREYALFGVASKFAASGHDNLAFEAVEKSLKEDHLLAYGAIAQEQAKRGDLTSWANTVRTRLDGQDSSGLVYAFQGLAEYYHERGNVQEAQNALLSADESLAKGELVDSEIWKDRFVEFCLDKLKNPATALHIAQTVEPSISAVESLGKIVNLLRKQGKLSEIPDVVALADKKAQAMVNERGELHDWTIPYAQMAVADMRIKIGDPEGVKVLSQTASGLKSDHLHIAQRLAKQGFVEAALYLAPTFDNPLTQLVVAETILEYLIEAKDFEKAQQVLTTAAAQARQLASQRSEKGNEYLPSHLIDLGQKSAQIGDEEKAIQLFNLAHFSIPVYDPKKGHQRIDRELNSLVTGAVESGYFEEAQRAADDIDDPGIRIIGQIKIASGLISEGRYDEAFEVLSYVDDFTTAILDISLVVPEQQIALAAEYYRLLMHSKDN